MTSIAYSNILSKLNSPIPDKKGGHFAFCPVHPDGRTRGRRSLHIREKDGRVLLFCHAGCDVEDIVSTLGLSMADLFVDERSKEEKRIGTIYNYRDQAGNLAYQVVRYEPKDFRCRRPDGRGGWIWNMRGVEPIPYRLPEMLQAVQRGETVFITEGEKDVDNLARLRLAATTSPMGAGKWREYYSDWLKGVNVIVLPDNDEPGRKHAQQVAQSLHAKAASVKVLELPGLPPKGDVSDWLAAGGTKEELLRLAQEAPEWEPAPRQEKAKKEDEHKQARQTSFFINGETLFEQIYLEGKSLFLAFNTVTGEVKIISFLELEEEIIGPIIGEDVELGAVRLPSGVEEYSDTLTLLAEIEAHIYRYLDVSPNYLKFAAYYVLLSWLYDRFHALPYLRALGDTGCGKSRFLDVIGGLCYKAISASGCVTPAPIYRMLRKWQGTLVLDEADMKNSDEYNEVVTILNCGFERGRPVIRATKDNPDKIQILPVYGPKVFATRRRFKDVALEARCLTEVMRETGRDDIPPVLGRKFFEEQRGLRNKLLLFRLRNYFNVDPEAAATLNLDGIEPRLRQISEAFTSLFANQPEVLASYKQFIQAHQRELIEQRAATKTGQVVEALLELLEERGGTSVTSGTSHMGDSELVTGVSAGDIAEKTGLSAQAVGIILKGLGIETKLNRRGSERKREILFNEAVFRKLYKRYIMQAEDMEQPALSTNKVVPLVTLVTEPDREVWEI